MTLLTSTATVALRLERPTQGNDRGGSGSNDATGVDCPSSSSPEERVLLENGIEDEKASAGDRPGASALRRPFEHTSITDNNTTPVL
ncbi:MAG TPA: hypothetical protein VNS88_17465 [Nitrospiraceae bacterium]|nr:hypothetical protein [Nitrospiraceae bacterium]